MVDTRHVRHWHLTAVRICFERYVARHIRWLLQVLESLVLLDGHILEKFHICGVVLRVGVLP